MTFHHYWSAGLQCLTAFNNIKLHKELNADINMFTIVQQIL